MSATAKRKFIMDATVSFVATHHAKPDADTAISWAEALWKRLCDRGYGPAAKSEPKQRVGTDYYGKLSQNSQKWFCLFFTNFKHPHGKQRAAMAWAELGNLTEDQHKLICEQATVESHRQIPAGQTRPMAEKWLRERRFEDNKTTANKRSAQDAKKAQAITEAAQEVAHFNTILKTASEDDKDFIKSEISRCQAKLDELKGQ